VLRLRRVALAAVTAGLLAAPTSLLGAQARPVPQALQAPRAPQAAIASALGGLAATGPIALRTLPRGTVLQGSDVGGDATGIVGFETQRVVVAGEPLRSPAIAPAAVVHAGDTVTARVEHDGVIVTRSGIALGTARLGQPVRVRLGQHSLSGIAVASGVVLLP